LIFHCRIRNNLKEWPRLLSLVDRELASYGIHGTASVAACLICAYPFLESWTSLTSAAPWNPRPFPSHGTCRPSPTRLSTVRKHPKLTFSPRICPISHVFLCFYCPAFQFTVHQLNNRWLCLMYVCSVEEGRIENQIGRQG
jgi:hypothetical protein